MHGGVVGCYIITATAVVQRYRIHHSIQCTVSNMPSLLPFLFHAFLALTVRVSIYRPVLYTDYFFFSFSNFLFQQVLRCFSKDTFNFNLISVLTQAKKKLTSLLPHLTPLSFLLIIRPPLFLSRLCCSFSMWL